jgi:hypothetical protein
MQNPTNDPIPGVITCNLAINTGPMHWQLDAVVHHLNEWVATQWNKVVDRALTKGYLVPEDARELRRAAAQSQIGE